MGKHIVAERMYRHYQEAMPHVLPRTAISADNADRQGSSPGPPRTAPSSRPAR